MLYDIQVWELAIYKPYEVAVTALFSILAPAFAFECGTVSGYLLRCHGKRALHFLFFFGTSLISLTLHQFYEFVWKNKSNQLHQKLA